MRQSVVFVTCIFGGVLMQTVCHSFGPGFDVAGLSRRMRVIVPVMISLAMLAVSFAFYRADAVFLKASVLPFYIVFFIVIYVSCLVIEYLSLWCDRGLKFHTARIAVHFLALVLITWETGMFFYSTSDVYCRFPEWSLSRAVSSLVDAPVSHRRLAGPDQFSSAS